VRRVSVDGRGGTGCPDYVSLQPVSSAGDTQQPADERFDSTGMFHYCSPRPIEDCLIVSPSPSHQLAALHVRKCEYGAI